MKNNLKPEIMNEIEWGPGFIIGTKLPWIFRFDQSLYLILLE